MPKEAVAPLTDRDIARAVAAAVDPRDPEARQKAELIAAILLEATAPGTPPAPHAISRDEDGPPSPAPALSLPDAPPAVPDAVAVPETASVGGPAQDAVPPAAD